MNDLKNSKKTLFNSHNFQYFLNIKQINNKFLQVYKNDDQVRYPYLIIILQQ